jgi:hypothetical protein
MFTDTKRKVKLSKKLHFDADKIELEKQWIQYDKECYLFKVIKRGWRTNQLCRRNQQRPSIHFLGNMQYQRITIKYTIIFLRPFVLPAIFGKAELFFEYFYCTHTINDSICPNSHWNPSVR